MRLANNPATMAAAPQSSAQSLPALSDRTAFAHASFGHALAEQFIEQSLDADEASRVSRATTGAGVIPASTRHPGRPETGSPEANDGKSAGGHSVPVLPGTALAGVTPADLSGSAFLPSLAADLVASPRSPERGSIHGSETQGTGAAGGKSGSQSKSVELNKDSGDSGSASLPVSASAAAGNRSELPPVLTASRSAQAMAQPVQGLPAAKILTRGQPPAVTADAEALDPGSKPEIDTVPAASEVGVDGRAVASGESDSGGARNTDNAGTPAPATVAVGTAPFPAPGQTVTESPQNEASSGDRSGERPGPAQLKRAGADPDLNGALVPASRGPAAGPVQTTPSATHGGNQSTAAGAAPAAAHPSPPAIVNGPQAAGPDGATALDRMQNTQHGAGSMVGAAVNPYQKLDQVSGPSGVVMSAGVNRMTVGVHDPALGWVEIKTQSTAGQVAAALTTSSSQTHEALAAQLPSLTQFLADREVRLSSIGIEQHAAGHAPGHSGQGNEQGSSRQPAGEPAQTVFNPDLAVMNRESESEVDGNIDLRSLSYISVLA